MKIKLNDYKNIIIDYIPTNKKIDSWYAENFDFIMNLIRSYIKHFGWAFGGASEMFLNIEELYRDHPYNLGDKYGATSKPYYLLAA